jgi:hypothetical protein
MKQVSLLREAIAGTQLSQLHVAQFPSAPKSHL